MHIVVVVVVEKEFYVVGRCSGVSDKLQMWLVFNVAITRSCGHESDDDKLALLVEMSRQVLLFESIYWCRWRSRRSIKSKSMLFSELALVLTSRGVYLKVNGEIYIHTRLYSECNWICK